MFECWDRRTRHFFVWGVGIWEGKRDQNVLLAFLYDVTYQIYTLSVSRIIKNFLQKVGEYFFQKFLHNKQAISKLFLANKKRQLFDKLAMFEKILKNVVTISNLQITINNLERLFLFCICAITNNVNLNNWERGLFGEKTVTK